jgi:hypothetical protein
MKEIGQTDQHMTTSTGERPRAGTEHAGAEPSARGPFPARVRGVNAEGRFKVSAVLENLSANYCDVLLDGRAALGKILSITTRVSRAVVVLRGTVVRTRACADGASSVAVRITRYRFVTRHTHPD